MPARKGITIVSTEHSPATKSTEVVNVDNTALQHPCNITVIFVVKKKSN